MIIGHGNVVYLSNPCDNTTFNEFSVLPYQDEYIIQYNSNLIIDLSEPSDSISLTKGTMDGYNFCGKRNLVLMNNSTGQIIYLNSSSSINFDSVSL